MRGKPDCDGYGIGPGLQSTGCEFDSRLGNITLRKFFIQMPVT